MPYIPASDALKRIRVLDVTRVRSGPTCVRQLADWGADVIRIETPAAFGDDGAVGSPRASADFQNLNRNKRSLTLDLKHADGHAAFMRLAGTADVVVENFRPDVKHRLKIDYQTLAAANAGIILASISGFGQDGPYAARPGFDQIAQGMGGLMSITGLPGQGPVRVGIPVADLTAGQFAAQGILVALLEREASRKGQWLHTSLLQAQIFMLDFQSARWLVDGEVPQQAGNNHPTSIPTGVFPTSDGSLNISVTGGQMWQRFCSTLGLDDLFDHPDYETEEKRSANRDTLNARIDEVIRTQSTEHWVKVFTDAGVPCGPIYNIDETFADPQVRHLQMPQSVTSQMLGTFDLVGQPIKLERTPSSLVAASPECGEHTDEILADLGYAEDQIAELRERDAI